MAKYRIFTFFCLVLCTPITNAAKIKLQVDGLNGSLRQNVRTNLSTLEDEDAENYVRFQSRVDTAIRQGLRALGYYEPTIDFEFQTKPELSRPILRAKVTPGEPVNVTAVNVMISGDAEKDPDYQQIVKKTAILVGSKLNQGDYDALKKNLQGLAWRKGYFDAEMKRSQLGVSVDRHESVWQLDFDSGKRYRFGKVHFNQTQIRDDYLQNLLPFREDDFYTSDQLGELNRRLAETGWFNAALVTPDFAHVDSNKQLPLLGELTPASRNTIDMGAGFSTSIGPRVTGTWRKPWMNSRGHSLQSTLSISAPEQILSLSYKIPLLANPLEQYYLIQSGFKRENLNDTQADSYTLNAARYWNVSSGWQRSLNVRWSYDDFTQADVTQKSMLISPGVSVRRTRQKGGLMPMWGDTQNYSIDVSNKLWGSDIDFVILQAQNVWIRTLAEKNRFVVRANVGWILADDFSRVPPSLRFFAGGDRSIRGYKYKSISPVDSSGKLIGATKMATGSLEYQYNVKDKWWAAGFVDTGQAVGAIRLDRKALKTGVGVGVRWASPIGPVKVDLATPVNDKEHRGIQFYIGLGPEL